MKTIGLTFDKKVKQPKEPKTAKEPKKAK